MELMQRSVYRPTREPAVATPLGARSVGHYAWPAGHGERPQVKGFVQLFWTVAGAGHMPLAAGPALALGPGDLALYVPGDRHDVTAGPAGWEYHWWTLDGPLAEGVTRGFGLAPGRVYAPGPAPVALFAALEGAMAHVTPDGERRAAALAFELLGWAAGGARETQAVADAAVQATLEHMQRHWADPALNVALLARRAGLHRSVLSRRFRAALGVAPITYLANLRMQRALALLKRTDLPVAAVAGRCGYDDPNYFARAVRRVTGQSPTAFRGRGGATTARRETGKAGRGHVW